MTVSTQQLDIHLSTIDDVLMKLHNVSSFTVGATTAIDVVELQYPVVVNSAFIATSAQRIDGFEPLLGVVLFPYGIFSIAPFSPFFVVKFFLLGLLFSCFNAVMVGAILDPFTPVFVVTISALIGTALLAGFTFYELIERLNNAAVFTAPGFHGGMVAEISRGKGTRKEVNDA